MEYAASLMHTLCANHGDYERRSISNSKQHGKRWILDDKQWILDSRSVIIKTFNCRVRARPHRAVLKIPPSLPSAPKKNVTLSLLSRSTNCHGREPVLSTGYHEHYLHEGTHHWLSELTDNAPARSPPDARGQQEEKKRRGVVQSHLLEIQRK